MVNWLSGERYLTVPSCILGASKQNLLEIRNVWPLRWWHGLADFVRFTMWRPSFVGVRRLVVVVLIFILGVVPVSLTESGNAVPALNICATRYLAGSASFQGENGYQVGILTLENIGLKSCRLPTRPSVVLVWHGVALVIHQLSMTDAQSRSFGGTALSVLKPRAKSSVGLAWHNWCQTLPPKTSPFNGSLLVSLSRSSSLVRINVKNIYPARCDLPREQSTLAVGRFRLP